jgi:hypothetical protein
MPPVRVGSGAADAYIAVFDAENLFTWRVTPRTQW